MPSIEINSPRAECDLIRKGKLLGVHCGNCRPEEHLYLNPEILRLPKSSRCIPRRLAPQEGSLSSSGRDMQRKSGPEHGQTIASTCPLDNGRGQPTAPTAGAMPRQQKEASQGTYREGLFVLRGSFQR